MSSCLPRDAGEDRETGDKCEDRCTARQVYGQIYSKRSVRTDTQVGRRVTVLTDTLSVSGQTDRWIGVGTDRYVSGQTCVKTDMCQDRQTGVRRDGQVRKA